MELAHWSNPNHHRTLHHTHHFKVKLMHSLLIFDYLRPLEALASLLHILDSLPLPQDRIPILVKEQPSADIARSLAAIHFANLSL